MLEFLIQVSLYVTNIFGPEVVVLFCIFMMLISFIYLNIKQIKYKEILSVNCPNNIKGIIIISLSVFLAGILSLFIKYMFKTLRPENMLVLENGYSFPSGHTAVIFSFCVSAVFILFKYFKDNNRVYLNYLHTALFVSLAFLVAFTRLVLQVHRFVDVIGGVILGVLCTFLSFKIYYNITRYVDFKIFK
jgi:membrane-associated phospholipid phosphatase